MNVFLVGGGAVGLVTAVGLSRLGHDVTVADIDGRRIANLRVGVLPIFEPGLDEAVLEGVSTGRLRFTTDLHLPVHAACSIITVSTPADDRGSLSTGNVEAAVRSILDAAPPEHVIVVRSTIPVEGVGRLAALRAGRSASASIVTNPEFLREGSALADFERPDRIVVGWVEPRDADAVATALALYSGINAPTLVADARSVAMIKLASNVFLAAKVAYANELARLCDAVGADVAIVADGLGLDRRIGRAFLTAGPGYGGSCLPDQAIALSVLAGTHGVTAPLVDSISRSNDAHQRAIVDVLSELLNVRSRSDQPRGWRLTAQLEGTRIAVLGLAFKANTDDVRGSPALAIARHLREAGATVVSTDPMAIRQAVAADPDLTTAATVELAVRGSDAVIVATEWAEYRDLDWGTLAATMRGDLVYDARGIVDEDRIREAGMRLVSLGRNTRSVTTEAGVAQPASASDRVQASATAG